MNYIYVHIQRETSLTLRTKESEYLKDKFKEIETYGKKK
jgi:hypothetical protein